jgi:PAS domain S-box-containing protein
MAQMLGYSVEEMMGKELLEFMDDDMKKIAQSNIERRRQGIQEQHDFPFLRKDNKPIWTTISTSPIIDEQGNYQGALGLLTDITERKSTELMIQNALAKEKELNELKNRLISMTSHEFRTPLSVISSSASILKNFSHKLSEEKKEKHLDIIQTYVQYTTQLLDDILLINKAEAGKMEFNPEPINISEFCQTIGDEIRINSLDRQLNFTIQGKFSQKIYQLDPKLLRHILINLLSNGIKYSPENSWINFKLIEAENELIFEISDQGMGIPPDEQDQLFEPFHRCSNIGTIKGTGLGLNIVKKSVELHGGKISFISKINQGTTFTVIIPIS